MDNEAEATAAWNALPCTDFRALAQTLATAADAVMKDHQERMAMYPDFNNQPNRVKVMSALDTALAAAKEAGIVPEVKA